MGGGILSLLIALSACESSEQQPTPQKNEVLPVYAANQWPGFRMRIARVSKGCNSGAGICWNDPDPIPQDDKDYYSILTDPSDTLVGGLIDVTVDSFGAPTHVLIEFLEPLPTSTDTMFHIEPNVIFDEGLAQELGYTDIVPLNGAYPIDYSTATHGIVTLDVDTYTP